jgi:hypothetical protein
MPSTGKLIGLAIADSLLGFANMFTGSFSHTTFEADQFQSVQDCFSSIFATSMAISVSFK